MALSEIFFAVNWLAVLAATIVYFALGALWYSPVLFAKIWMELRGITYEDIGEPDPVIFVKSFILQAIAVFTLALFISAMQLTGTIYGLMIGFAAGAGILFSLSGTTGLFSDTPFKLHLIDNGYHLAGLTIAGGIIGLWS